MSAGVIKALIVVTSHAQLGATGQPTGYYLPEVSHPFAALVAQGIDVDVASPEGGEAPVDPKSLDLDDPVNKRFWETPATRRKVRETLRLADVDAADYDAVIFAGGHGTMWDFPANAEIARLGRSIFESGGVVAAVCHGPAALLAIKLADGRPIVAGRRVAGFSDAEEAAAGLTTVMPFLLEAALREQGGQYSAASLWQPHVVVDGRLVTGQNPASAQGVGAATARLLTEGRRSRP